MQILINGSRHFFDISEVALCSLKGVFETILVVNNNPVMWDAHMRRLQCGCQMLDLSMPESQLLAAELPQALEGAAQAIIKIIIFRDEMTGLVKRVVAAKPFPAESVKQQQAHGIHVILCKTPLPSQSSAFKHLQRHCYIAARQEVQNAQADDGLLFDQNNNMIESTIANIFLVKNDQSITPILSQTGIKGIMRDSILSTVNGIEKHVTLNACLQADELFLCNSVRGILPIVKLQQKNFSIGRMTRALQKQCRLI